MESVFQVDRTLWPSDGLLLYAAKVASRHCVQAHLHCASPLERADGAAREDLVLLTGIASARYAVPGWIPVRKALLP